MQTSTHTISAERLCSLTGLTDRRHRQLAKQGYFPPPTNGNYPLNQTITGLFKYFRERAKGADPLTKARQAEIESRTALNHLAIDEKQRKLVPVAELGPIIGKFLTEAKSKIYGHPKLEQEEKDALLECLGQCLDLAFGIPAPEAEPEGKSQAETTD